MKNLNDQDNDNDDLEEPESPLIKTYKEIAPFLTLGMQLAVTITVMFFIGKWIDDKYETTPVWIIIFTFAGAIGGLYNFIKTVLDYNKKKK